MPIEWPFAPTKQNDYSSMFWSYSLRIEYIKRCTLAYYKLI